jgi:hypothetical protein
LPRGISASARIAAQLADEQRPKVGSGSELELEGGRERKANRDTFNADDFIFVRQGGAETIVALKEKGGSRLAGLVIGIER